MTQKVLVIEDEPTLARLLSYNLSQEGYDTTVIDHGAEGLQVALQRSFDLIILDIMLPGMNGFEILSSLRQNGNRTPVIVLTARNAEEEVVQGLETRRGRLHDEAVRRCELLARVSAVLRRTSQDDGKLTESTDKVITAGDLSIYPERYEVVLNGERYRFVRRNSKCCCISCSAPAWSLPAMI